MVNLTTHLAYLREKYPRTHRIDAMCAQSSSESFGEERVLKALSGLKPRAVQPLAHVDSDVRTINVLDLYMD